MKTSDFEYNLPPEYIAQSPIEPRDHSRLLVVDRRDETVSHHSFFELPGFLKKGDVLVFNDSRVIPARLTGKKEGTGGKVEVLLLRRLQPGLWEALVKPAKRLRAGSVIEFYGLRDGDRGTGAGGGKAPVMTGEVEESGAGGMKTIRLSDESHLDELGTIPLPPYIKKSLENQERYQTVYARISGSVAAPTAGLHFTPRLLKDLEEKGVEVLFTTLHIGLDTFRPVSEEEPEHHTIHREFGVVTETTVLSLNRAMSEGRRIIAVGTTTVRILEAVAAKKIPLEAWRGDVDLFILPGFHFRVVNAMITNYHLPRSTLLMLVSAFAGMDLTRRAYEEAIARKYRFYSFGDAMLLL
ncbi:MAG: tRNA preQ1(34) S-adenosylmethionine ribosyltransferase-isomerase QueA [Dehalococcoidia bacterium]|nr:tRNA preQ1(34) S-adenosylmethionine ribosyltransferase-isomerase QueA [Dehalococcoidia bacterium]